MGKTLSGCLIGMIKLKLVIIFCVISFSSKGQIPTVGISIQGDFVGDGKKEVAIIVRIKEQVGNPADGGTAAEYSISFSTSKIKSFKVGTGAQNGSSSIILINEGDLFNSGKDAISVYKDPINGCTGSMSTYLLIDRVWKQIIGSFTVPNFCDGITNNDLQKRIFKENGVVYFYSLDTKDSHFKLVKKKAVLKFQIKNQPIKKV